MEDLRYDGIFIGNVLWVVLKKEVLLWNFSVWIENVLNSILVCFIIVKKNIILKKMYWFIKEKNKG